MTLTSDQERYLQRVRDVVAEADAADPDVLSLARSVGALQWPLGEMIRLVQQVANS